MLRRKRVLAAKAEVTPGTAESLTGSEAAFNVFDPTPIQPAIEFEQREGQSSFAPLFASRGAGMGNMSFSMEIHGGSTVPAWASVFLTACGFVDNGSGVLTPKTLEPAGTGTASRPRTLTLGSYVDGTLKILCGAMGNAVFRLAAGRKAMVDFSFTGKIVHDNSDVFVADTSLLTPTYPTTKPLKAVDTALLFGGAYSPRWGNLTIDLGNEVYMVQNANAADRSGYAHACIGGRRITGTIDPEGVLVATKDWHNEWLTMTEQALAFELTDDANQKVDFDAPAFQIIDTQEGERDGLVIETISFQLNRSASAGEDELAITFSDPTP